ncbi:MAG: hypothetical protein ACR2ML_09060 [Solirubrobacteraceae bacterium]
MTDPDLETPRPPSGEGFSDAVTLAFGDAEAQLYGLLRVGLVPEHPVHPGVATATGTAARASGLALLFAGRDLAAPGVVGAVPVAEPGYAPPELQKMGIETVEPLKRWHAHFEGDDGGFSLEVAALSPPLTFGESDPAGVAAASQGYEQLCLVEGTVLAGGEEQPIRCLGQRGHTWGAPDWDRLELTRTLSAWMGEDAGLALASVRPARAKAHAEEAVSAFLFEAVDDGVAARPIGDARLSTTYDGAGRQRRAGLELWENEEAEYPRRASGEVLCGTSLELGRLRLDCAFFAWHMDGREGVGRYDVLRRV